MKCTYVVLRVTWIRNSPYVARSVKPLPHEIFISNICGVKWYEIQDITSRLTLVAAVTSVNGHFCVYFFKEKGSQS